MKYDLVCKFQTYIIVTSAGLNDLNWTGTRYSLITMWHKCCASTACDWPNNVNVMYESSMPWCVDEWGQTNYMCSYSCYFWIKIQWNQLKYEETVYFNTHINISWTDILWWYIKQPPLKRAMIIFLQWFEKSYDYFSTMIWKELWLFFYMHHCKYIHTKCQPINRASVIV